MDRREDIVVLGNVVSLIFYFKLFQTLILVIQTVKGYKEMNNVCGVEISDN